MGRDGCVRRVGFKVLRIGMAIGAASVFTKVKKHTNGSRCGVARCARRQRRHSDPGATEVGGHDDDHSSILDGGCKPSSA
jgi:hypothetical protein